MPSDRDRRLPASSAATAQGGGWVDVSMPLRPGMPSWPGEPGFAELPVKRGPAHTSLYVLGSHTGTHLDAPRHFVPGGTGIDEAPTSVLLGLAYVVTARQGRLPTTLPACDRLLLRTGGHGIGHAAARRLAKAGLGLVGIDHLSIARDGMASDVHRTLFAAGTWILEGLELAQAPDGPYDLVCLPLRVTGGDGAPARAMLRPRPEPI